ncbi:cysteine proteinase [Daldinia sp. FL1419]|nr:cysteine proteinase [Daldinia sp. FL1419]
MPGRPGRNHLNHLGSVQPMNNLNGNKQSHPHTTQSPPIRRRQDSPPAPPPKRQRVEEYSTHTQAQFVLVPENDGPANRPDSRKRPFDDHSDSQQTFISQSSAKGAQSTETRVLEYKSSECYVRPPPKNRPRHNSIKHVGDSGREIVARVPLLKSDIEDSDGDVEIVGAPEVVTIPQTRQNQEARLSIQDGARRFKATSGAQRMDEIIDTAIQNENEPNSVVSSPDELAPKTQDIREKVPTKRPASSLSLSGRGDITRTKFIQPSRIRPQGPSRGPNESNKAARIIDSGLCVARAVSGGYKYDARQASDAKGCYLNLREMSHILHPENSEGEHLREYAYLTVNLKKVKRILALPNSADCLVVSIDRAVDGSISGGSKLLVEFLYPADLRKFVEWARGTASHNLVAEPIARDRLNKELENMMKRATSHIVRSDELRGDDVKLIEHNLANTNQTRATDPPHLSTLKIKNILRQSVASPSNSEITIIPDDPQPYDIRRTTRSTYTYESSSSESECPELEGWTTQHEGWERNWRNSLVFPPHGKSRATVDKEDIPRLDEGQFLNDNLIIFYLRYLQHTLEAERPDLAQRIYFQNTYFYEKLKSTRTTQGINYDSVKAWTSKVDLFTKDYIIVPINEFTHWYVAIIYNAPKLLPSPGKMDDTNGRPKDTITIEEDADDSREVSCAVSRASSDGGKLNEPESPDPAKFVAQSDVTKYFSLPETEGQEIDAQLTSCKQEEVTETRHSDFRGDVKHTMPSNESPQRKKSVKIYSTNPKRYDPEQPKIITLDSLGLSHSPACSCLKQYLIAELKDKKNIEIEHSRALGMTAKDVPQQTNHCDCGLYLLGYITEFLKDPDGFIRSILRRKPIAWDLNPSELRNNIRDLIFNLQEEQQRREDQHKEEKRNKAALKRKTGGSISERPLKKAAKEQDTDRGTPELQKEEDAAEKNNTAKPQTSSPTPEVPLEARSVPDSENRPIPGSFPRSPAVASTGIIASIESNAEGAKTARFVSPLPGSPRGSSPTRPMVVEDSEAPQKRGQDINHIHSNPKQASPLEESTKGPQRSYQSHDGPVDETRKQETSTQSPYFGGRQPGDKMASARLREEPVHSDVIDISD